MATCPLCQAAHRVTYYRGTRSGDVHRCTACGFVYADPRGEHVAGGPPARTDEPAVYLENARHRLGLLRRYGGVAGGRLLDVGCYDGGFLLAAQQLGFAGTGVEPSARGAALARERGLTIVAAPFEQAEFAAPFDAITFIHSLEHFENPRQALSLARRHLQPNGALLVEVPNFAAWSRPLLGRRWRQFIADHHQFFEPPTLHRCLAEAGFAVREMRPVSKILSLGLLADRVERYYNLKAGRALAGLLARRRWTEKQISLNLGDILLAVATVARER